MLIIVGIHSQCPLGAYSTTELISTISTETHIDPERQQLLLFLLYGDKIGLQESGGLHHVGSGRLFHAGNGGMGQWCYLSRVTPLSVKRTTPSKWMECGSVSLCREFQRASSAHRPQTAAAEPRLQHDSDWCNHHSLIVESPRAGDSARDAIELSHSVPRNSL